MSSGMNETILFQFLGLMFFELGYSHPVLTAFSLSNVELEFSAFLTTFSAILFLSFSWRVDMWKSSFEFLLTSSTWRTFKLFLFALSSLLFVGGLELLSFADFTFSSRLTYSSMVVSPLNFDLEFSDFWTPVSAVWLLSYFSRLDLWISLSLLEFLLTSFAWRTFMVLFFALSSPQVDVLFVGCLGLLFVAVFTSSSLRWPFSSMVVSILSTVEFLSLFL